MAHVLAQHGQVLAWRGPNDVAEQRQPEPDGAFVRGSVAVEVRHLLAVFFAKLSRIEPQETAVEACARDASRQ